MAMKTEPPGVSTAADLVSAEPSMGLSPVQPVTSQSKRGQGHQSQNPMVTGVALTQGWSFAGLTADPESPEPATSRSAQSSSHAVEGAVLSLAFQDSPLDTTASDTAESHSNSGEASAGGSTLASKSKYSIHEQGMIAGCSLITHLPQPRPPHSKTQTVTEYLMIAVTTARTICWGQSARARTRGPPLSDLQPLEPQVLLTEV